MLNEYSFFFGSFIFKKKSGNTIEGCKSKNRSLFQKCSTKFMWAVYMFLLIYSLTSKMLFGRLFANWVLSCESSFICTNMLSLCWDIFVKNTICSGIQFLEIPEVRCTNLDFSISHPNTWCWISCNKTSKFWDQNLYLKEDEGEKSKERVTFDHHPSNKKFCWG